MHSSPIKVCAIRRLIGLPMDKASGPAYVRVVETVFRVRVFALVCLLGYPGCYGQLLLGVQQRITTSPPGSGQTRLDVLHTQRVFALLGGALDLLLGPVHPGSVSLIGFFS